MGKITSSDFDKRYPELSILLHDFNDCGVGIRFGLVQTRESEDVGRCLVELAWGNERSAHELVAVACDQAVTAGFLTTEEGHRIKSGGMTEGEAMQIEGGG